MPEYSRLGNPDVITFASGATCSSAVDVHNYSRGFVSISTRFKGLKVIWQGKTDFTSASQSYGDLRELTGAFVSSGVPITARGFGGLAIPQAAMGAAALRMRAVSAQVSGIQTLPVSFKA